MSLILPTSIVRHWFAGDSYSVDNTPSGGVFTYVTKAPGNKHYEEVMAWIAAGNVAEPEFTAAEMLENKRRNKIDQIVSEGVRRISAVIPELDSLNKISVVAALWPVLDNPGANSDFARARDIYVYARNLVNFAKTATDTQLDSFDPPTDPNWPT